MQRFRDFFSEETRSTARPTCTREMKKDFMFHVVFGFSLILICLLFNVALWFTVRGPFEVAIKEQTYGWSGVEHGEVQKIAIFFYLAGLFNLISSIVALQRFNSAMGWVIYLINHGRAFERPIWITGFLIRKTIIQSLLVMALVMIIVAGMIIAIAATTPFYIWNFALINCWFSFGCLLAAFQFVHEMKNLKQISEEEEILHEHVGNLSNV
ncbi:unnamed protein product [Orchesella dallaii]|uniref:Uncharacterized protein n=1 Tax=Orchesella dallaii TaxID=48710 RepID=A0ABP1RCR4_9HEXA